MYVPTHFEETRIEVLHQFIRAHPLGALVTLTPTGLDANHVPFELDPASAPFGTLRAHIARANPLWRECSNDAEALVIFQGPSGYISPSWYPAKRETGKVVPTWNYAVVHAHGRLRAVDDPDWLRRLVERLTDRHEAGRRDPWSVADAPPDFVNTQLRAVLGLELTITRLRGKWKMSQNRSPGDREGVARGLLDAGDEASAALAALIVPRRGE